MASTIAAGRPLRPYPALTQRYPPVAHLERAATSTCLYTANISCRCSPVILLILFDDLSDLINDSPCSFY